MNASLFISVIGIIFRLKSTRLLIAMSMFSIALSLTRMALTGQSRFGFLLWNLALAAVPWLLSNVAFAFQSKSRIIRLLLALLWLLFFPNAPYIFTDLIHLGYGGGVPLWYDLVLILSFAFTGLSFGFVSLQNIEQLLDLRSARKRRLLSFGLIYLSCFGVYLGRFLRWNSWDLFNNAPELLQDVVDRIVNPFVHSGTWAFTFLLGTVLAFVYESYSVLMTRSGKITEPS